MVVEGLGELEMEPIRSRLTGNQLAAGVKQDLDWIAAQIAAREREIETLLAAA